MTEYLSLEELLLLTRKLGAGPVRDPGLVDSFAARPQATVFGDDAYPTLPMKAAALLHSICSNHALVDGNKRLAWLAPLAFLAVNGTGIEMPDDEAFELVMGVADGSIDVEQIAAKLEASIVGG